MLLKSLHEVPCINTEAWLNVCWNRFAEFKYFWGFLSKNTVFFTFSSTAKKMEDLSLANVYAFEVNL